MDVRELMIGNLIHWELNDPRDINNGDDFDYGYDECKVELWMLKYPDQISPIPITKEWLEKLGFVCYSDGYCHLPSKGISFNDYKSNMINLCVGKYCQEGEDLPHIKHVHQLQNLYLSLTGEELTIYEKQ